MGAPVAALLRCGGVAGALASTAFVRVEFADVASLVANARANPSPACPTSLGCARCAPSALA
jgi:hypothetical protein